MTRLIDQALLDRLEAEAARSPRRRRNLNFHGADHHPAHRLLNAVATDSYIPPHRHLHETKDETFLVLRGRLGLLTFDDQGHVTRTIVMAPGSDCLGADLPHGTWHTLVALDPGTVFLEAKAGPYQPLADDERAPWAPAEGAPDANAYLEKLRRLLPP